jgi:hypothetical protein
MSCIRFAIFALLLGLFGSAEIAIADEAANVWKALRAGGH